MRIAISALLNLRASHPVAMPRLPGATLIRVQPTRTLVANHRLLSSTSGKHAGTQNSRPGWEGRDGDDHVVKRSETDVQAEAAHSGMRQKAQGGEGSQGLSQKDERNSNKRAKEEHPEAPEPVIGMNSERGSKGH